MIVKPQRLTHVDDEPDIRAIARFVLKEIGGYELDACASGSEALERMPEFNPHLIILDVMMPDMDGIRTFELLRVIPGLADTPVVFMTAKVAKTDTDRYLALGAADVIAKPFDPMTLPDRIVEIWRRAHKNKLVS